MPCFQKWHFEELLTAEPFRPFILYLADGQGEWRIGHPSIVTFKGDVPVIEGETGDCWVNPDAIAFIEVLRASASPGAGRSSPPGSPRS